MSDFLGYAIFTNQADLDNFLTAANTDLNYPNRGTLNYSGCIFKGADCACSVNDDIPVEIIPADLKSFQWMIDNGWIQDGE